MAQKEGGNRVSAISRREALRRGAVVGGTLLWATPAIQSFNSVAFAGNYTSCCECKSPNPSTGFQCGVDMFSKDACDSFCGGMANVAFYGTGNFNCTAGPDGKKHCVTA